MSIKNRIPKEFYKLFNSKYVEYFQRILIALYEQSASSYSLLGLTEEECQDTIEMEISTFTMDFSQVTWRKRRTSHAGEYGVSDASKAGRVGMAPKGL
ncbi:MAG: hypothetical protein ACLTUL_20560 [Blautia faecis]